MKKILIAALISIIGFSSLAFAKEQTVTIIVSGQSHAALYPCACPKAPLGGVMRRATVIKDIRKKDKNVLLLEAGGSFAGGNFDQNSQTTDLDKKRTEFYMDSLAEMGYDAFLVSSEEFNFGAEFLEEMRSKYALNYLSANLKGDFLPFTLHKVGMLNIAVIGITDARVSEKSSLEYMPPQTALANTVSELRKNKDIHMIVVVSYLERDDSVELIKQVDGINVWISSNNPFRPAQTEQIDSTALVIPAWEARSITKIVVTHNQGNPLRIDIEEVPLGQEVRDDVQVRSMIPVCFASVTCAKPGFAAECLHAGTLQASCRLTEIKPIALTVIKPKVCKTCDIDTAINKIKEAIPAIKATVIADDTRRARELIKQLNIAMLPAYLIDASVESEQIKSILDRIATKVDSYYMVKMNVSGVSYFVKRKKVPNRLDVFFDITTKDIVGILDVLQELKRKHSDIEIALHFLMIKDPKEGFLAKGGTYEIEEYKRCACVGKHYPEKLWDYLSCRLSTIESSWWDDCLLKFDMDPATIRSCAQSQEGASLLGAYIALTQELEVVFGPTFVINNQEIFSAKGQPRLEELEELFKK